MAALSDADSEDQDAAEQLARDGARPLRAGDPLDARGTRSLLSSARHELGSPLQSIQGFGELLATEAFGALSKEQHGFVEHILAASNELRSAMEACLELAELELVGPSSSSERVDLQAALADALEHAQARTGIATSRSPTEEARPPVARVELDRDVFRRAFETLLIALSARDAKSFVVDTEQSAEYALVSVARPARRARAQTLSLPALAAARPLTRNLLWFRLAAALFAALDVQLSLTESLDCAEVRIRLCATH